MIRLRDDRGASVVEFALVFPILIMLVLGIVEFGRAYNIQTTLSAAARDGARVMAIRHDTDLATDAVQSVAIDLDLGDEQIDISPMSCDSGDTATVTVHYPMALLTGLFGAQIVLTGKGVMRCNG